MKKPAQTNGTYGYKGMIMTNPGGPGESGVQFVKYSDVFGISNVTGDAYDLVSFDPRGIASSRPNASCAGLDALRKRDQYLSIPRFADSFWKVDEAASIRVGEACAKEIGEPDGAGPHMTTAVNVRDMISILDAFAETEEGNRVKDPKMLNYWGFSYGTFLGQTFASMFPDRVGRMIFDAVAQPEDYFANFTPHNIEFTDEIVTIWFEYCHQAGSKCSFNTGSSAKDVHNRYDRISSRLQARTAENQKWKNATVIENALESFKQVTQLMVYSPIGDSGLFISFLEGFETALKNGTLENVADSFHPTDPAQRFSPGFLGISCSDSDSRYAN